MIAPTLISNFDEIVKKMIFNSEGDSIRQPSIIRGNDHTITYGYGYTFIRKDSKGKCKKTGVRPQHSTSGQMIGRGGSGEAAED